MMLFDPREPISAWSHGAGMMLALGLTWVFRNRYSELAGQEFEVQNGEAESPFRRGKFIALLIFGFSLICCYGFSALYHSVNLSGGPLNRFRRLDHVGIYLLIAGTYTPAVWSLMERTWRHRTLLTVWAFAGCCAARVWIGGIFPTWMSTLIYLGLGWGVLVCYHELSRNLSHGKLLPLPLGGVFYSIGALINLTNWPVLQPGVFGSHELFHFFVIAGSTCHVYFMFRVVIPASEPTGWRGAANVRASHALGLSAISVRSGARFLTLRDGVRIRRHHLEVGSDGRSRWMSRALLMSSGPLLRASLGKTAQSEAASDPTVILNPAEP
jgi:hemolysin III